MQIKWESVRHWIRRSVQIAALPVVLAAGLRWYFAAVPVVEHRIETGVLVAEVMGTGTLEARIKSTISPKIAGRVHEVFVDQGDHVKAGQPLFTLDDAELKQQVEIAQATLALWQASLDRLQADHDQSKAILDSAQKDSDRIAKLLVNKAVSAEEGDKATERLRIAEAGLSRSVAAQLEGRKQIATAEKSLAFSEARLADTQVVAPFDGLIVKRYRDPGDIGVPGSPILMLVSKQEIWVSAWVDETEMSRLQPDQSARVVFRSEAGKNYQGKVTRLGREADRETREFVVDVGVVTLPANWAVGQRAEVYVEVDRKSDVPLVPTKFVFWHGNTPGVFCRDGDRACWREITLGLRGAETVEVSKGLAVGESVLMPAAGKNVSLENQRVAAAP
jgi:RND family efflux transporter MFP subunit